MQQGSQLPRWGRELRNDVVTRDVYAVDHRDAVTHSNLLLMPKKQDEEIVKATLEKNLTAKKSNTVRIIDSMHSKQEY